MAWCRKITDSSSNAGLWLLQADRDCEFGGGLDRLAYNILGEHLFTEGYVVFPIYTPRQSDSHVSQFLRTEQAFPEYLPGIQRGNKTNPYVLGGFGAYGNPASFHNPFVRGQRAYMCRYIPIFGALLKKADEENRLRFPAPSYSVSLQMDRMCKRPKGTSTTAESYHRDLIPTGRDGDFTIGGWIQFSKGSSFFSCVPRTHRFSVEKSTKGFATQKNKKCTTTIEVPQGHVLLFLQNMGHCVHATKQKQDSIRLFVNFLLTPHRTPIFDYKDVILDQGVPRLPSNQKIPMYGANHASFWLDRLTIPWSSRNFPPALLTLKHKADGTPYRVVDSPMKSLATYQLPLYPVYEKWERAMFEPFQTISFNGSTYRLFV